MSEYRDGSGVFLAIAAYGLSLGLASWEIEEKYNSIDKSQFMPSNVFDAAHFLKDMFG